MSSKILDMSSKILDMSSKIIETSRVLKKIKIKLYKKSL